MKLRKKKNRNSEDVTGRMNGKMMLKTVERDG